MAQSDQAVRDIVAQLVASQQPAAAPVQVAAPAPEDDSPAPVQMGSMVAPSVAPTGQMGSTLAVPARSTFAATPFTPQPGAAFPPPVSGNLIAAQQQMNLSPQEQALYSRHLTNLVGPGGVDNPDGSRSTLYQATQEHKGKFYNIPTVWNGKRETQPYTRQDGSTLDVPNATALANVDKAGWDNFPSYATPEAADSRYDQMHGYMEKDTADYMKQRGR